MTVQKLIDELNKVKDKELTVTSRENYKILLATNPESVQKCVAIDFEQDKVDVFTIVS